MLTEESKNMLEYWVVLISMQAANNICNFNFRSNRWILGIIDAPEFACMQLYAKIIDFSFANENSLNWITMIWCNANFQCIFHLNHLVNSHFIWTCNKFCCIIHIEYSSYREKLECEYDTNTHQWRIYIVKFWVRPSLPPGSKFCQFHAVFGKIWQNRMLAPPGRLAPPPRRN